MKAIGYARVSTDKQADRGVSLEAQTAKIQAMASLQDADLVDMIVDAGESAKSLDRPGMERLLALVESGAVNTVIVAKLDRLTRSVKDLATLLERFQKRGVSLVSVAESLDTGSAAGRLVLNIMVSVSQWEREAIGERTRDAMRHKKASAERVGAIPFGYRMAADGVHLEADEAEQLVVGAIHELRRVGLSTRAIASTLNERGHRLRRGAEWTFGRVAQVLRAGAIA
jgi:site-specific DNA recombinase